MVFGPCWGFHGYIASESFCFVDEGTLCQCDKNSLRVLVLILLFNAVYNVGVELKNWSFSNKSEIGMLISTLVFKSFRLYVCYFGLGYIFF